MQSKAKKESPSVLVVDGDHDSLESIHNILIEEGYQVYLASTSGKAWKILDDTITDLVLLNLRLPETDGLTFYHKMKEDKHAKYLPVIIMASRYETLPPACSPGSGCLDYIIKPVQKMELIARVSNIIELSAVRKEIREQKKQAHKFKHAKDRLYTIIAHDIKSSFSNIKLLVSSLAEGYPKPGSEEYKEVMQSISRSTQETHALLENLLLWTRSQTGDLHVRAELLDLNELVDRVFYTLEVNAVNKIITLKKKTGELLPVYADRNMMQSIIQNLVHNAIKFTPQNGTVTLEGYTEGKKVILKIMDTGVGIPAENMEKLFADKEQLTTPGTGDEEGTGLGLFLVQHFVKRNGGSITADSKPGRGTTITIFFPKAGQ